MKKLCIPLYLLAHTSYAQLLQPAAIETVVHPSELKVGIRSIVRNRDEYAHPAIVARQESMFSTAINAVGWGYYSSGIEATGRIFGISAEGNHIGLNVKSKGSEVYSPWTCAINATGELEADGIVVKSNNKVSLRAIAETNSVDNIVAHFTHTTGGKALIIPKGSVGIGTENPVGILDVRGSNSGSIFNFGVNEDTFIIGGKASSRVLIGDFFENSKIGMGVYNPDQKLDLMGRMRIRHSNAGTAGLWFTNSSDDLGISNGAFLGLENAMSGSERAGIWIGGAWRFNLDRNGNAWFAGNVTANSTLYPSDIRYKENIMSIGSSLASLESLHGVRYFLKTSEFESKGFPTSPQIGLLAQEVEKVYPEMVVTDAQGYKAVDYARMVPVLLEAIKELAAEVKLLKER